MLNLRRLFVVLPAAALLGPAWVVAGTKQCPAGAPTATSYNWNFSAEASDLLDQMESRAVAISEEVSALPYHAQFNDLDWRSYGNSLTRIQNDVNEMGEHLCRLQVIRPELLPWQQKAVDRIAPRIATLAAQTNFAIELLNDYRDSTWATAFPESLERIRNGAAWVSNSVDTYLEYAEVREKYRELEDATELFGS